MTRDTNDPKASANSPREPRRSTAWPLPDPGWPTAAEARDSRLFSPLALGPLELRTRSWVPAMVPWRSMEEGFVTPSVLDWYGRFADGRPGAIVVEATGIRDMPSGPLLRIGDDRFIPGLRELVEIVRERSQGETKLFIQAIDFLRIRRRPPRERYLEKFLSLRPAHREALASLAVLGERDAYEITDVEVRAALEALDDDALQQVLDKREWEELNMGSRERVTDTHLAHIEELPRVLPQLFADAARRAREAGFDGIELHYAHAYTMASFLSRLNDRADGYGGTAEGRLRLPLEVFERVRAEVGDDWTVGCRILGDEVIDGGSRIEDATFYAGRLARAGMDFISISKGGKFEDARKPRVGAAAYPYTGKSGLECMPTVRIEDPGPFGRNLPLSRAVREALRDAGLKTPVIGAGGIGTFALAEAALRNGDCDIVAAARQSLADPDWWRKIELGRGAEVRRCIYTNYCEGLDQKHLEVTCQLWDRDFAGPDAGSDPDTEPARTADGKRRLTAPEWRFQD